MQILFAVPDRDLLSAYQIILEDENMKVRTAFDGTQILSKLREAPCDLLILSDDIPRISAPEIVRFAKDEKIPVLMLRTDPDRKKRSCLVETEAELGLPFEPSELLEKIRLLEESLSSGKSEESIEERR